MSRRVGARTRRAFGPGGGIGIGSSGGGAPAPFTPSSLSGLVLWLDPLDNTTKTLIQASITSPSVANAAWTKTNVTAVAGASDPDGGTAGVTVTVTGATPGAACATTNVETGTSARIGVKYEFLVKFVDVPYVVLEAVTGQATNRVWFKNDGTVGTVGAAMRDASIALVADDWYRCRGTMNVTATGTTAVFGLKLSTADAALTDPAVATSVLIYNASISQTLISGDVNKASAFAATNAVAGTRLGLAAEGINGRQSYEGRAAQQLIGTEPAVCAAVESGDPFTVIFTAQNFTLSNNLAIFGFGGTVNSSRTRTFGQNTTGAGRWAAVSISDAVVSVSSVSGGATDLLPHRHAWVCTGTTMGDRVDDSAYDPALATAHNVGTLTQTKWGLGCRPDLTPDQQYSGYIGDVLVYNRQLTAGELTQVDEWLQSRWYDPDPPLPTPPIDPNVVDVLAFIYDQSNGAGQGTEAPAATAGLKMFSHVIGAPYSGTIQDLGPYAGALHGAGIKACNQVASVGQLPFKFKVAEGGTDLQAWLAGTPRFDIIHDNWVDTCGPALAALHPGKTFRFHVIVMIGESDAAKDPSDPDVLSWASDLATSIANSVKGNGANQLDWAADHTVYTYVVKTWTYGGAGYPALPDIRAAQDSCASLIPNCTVIETSSFAMGSDGVHYGSRGLNQIGNALAVAILTNLL